jgi:predicted kinase
VEAVHEAGSVPAFVPLLVFVSGAPGSGKTTLARQLADHLQLPHLNKDIIRDGLCFSGAQDVPVGAPVLGWDVWYETLVEWLQRGVSLVADQTLYRGESETDIGVLGNTARAVNVHTRAASARERFAEKMHADPRNDAATAALLVARFDEIHDRVRDPVQLGWPRIEVATDRPVDVARLGAQVLRAAPASAIGD